MTRDVSQQNPQTRITIQSRHSKDLGFATHRRVTKNHSGGAVLASDYSVVV